MNVFPYNATSKSVSTCDDISNQTISFWFPVLLSGCYLFSDVQCWFASGGIALRAVNWRVHRSQFLHFPGFSSPGQFAQSTEITRAAFWHCIRYEKRSRGSRSFFPKQLQSISRARLRFNFWNFGKKNEMLLKTRAHWIFKISSANARCYKSFMWSDSGHRSIFIKLCCDKWR